MLVRPQMMKLRPTLCGCVNVFAQRLSTSPFETKPERIGSNITFRPAGSVSSSSERPMVLMFGWLLSSSRHIYKYSDYYLGNNFDVLHVKIDPIDLLRPKRAFKVLDQMVDFLAHSDRSSQKLIVHGFSVGGYLHAHLMRKLANSGEREKAIGNRFVGQIMDSVVDVAGAAEGISKSFTDKPALQKTLQVSIETYLYLMEKSCTQYMRQASVTFHGNALELPSHFFYSYDDPVGDYRVIEALIEKWEKRGIAVTGKSWTDTKHVAHFLKYPVEYIDSLSIFLKTLDLIQPQLNQGTQDSIKERPHLQHDTQTSIRERAQVAL